MVEEYHIRMKIANTHRPKKSKMRNKAGSGGFLELINLQSSVKTFLPGFGNAWLKYCAVVHLWGGQVNILRVILEN